uniref:Glucosylceramidase n=1 Tax=Acrobeloides nanus TaxID=290746 RepID=A0A914EHQ2_9BILA
MIWDFNRGNARDYIDTVLADPDAAKYTNGIAMHWYDDFGWFGPAYGSQVLQNIHDNHPDKWILNTEACTYYKPNLNLSKVEIGNWYHADYYARDIIDDLNHWSTGFVDWNMALNETGEPRWNDTYYDKNETIDAPIIVSKDGSEFYKQPSYYVIGHFSIPISYPYKFKHMDMSSRSYVWNIL